MRKILSLLIFLGLSVTASAQWQYVSADSIMTWDNDVANLRTTALKASPQLRPQVIKAQASQLEALQKAWREEKTDAPFNLSTFDAANRFTLAARLLMLTADSEYALSMEQLIYGPLLQAATTPDLSAEKITAAQTLMNAVGTMLATRGDTVYVNFYANATAILQHSTGSFQLDLITAMPFHERVKLRLARMENTQGKNITFCIRLPEGEWNDKTFPIYCNGHDTPYRVEQGYAVITNTWRPGFEIYFDLPRPLLEMR